MKREDYTFITDDEYNRFLNTSICRCIPILMVEIGLAWGVCYGLQLLFGL